MVLTPSAIIPIFKSIISRNRTLPRSINIKLRNDTAMFYQIKQQVEHSTKLVTFQKITRLSANIADSENKYFK